MFIEGVEPGFESAAWRDVPLRRHGAHQSQSARQSVKPPPPVDNLASPDWRTPPNGMMLPQEAEYCAKKLWRKTPTSVTEHHSDTGCPAVLLARVTDNAALQRMLIPKMSDRPSGIYESRCWFLLTLIFRHFHFDTSIVSSPNSRNEENDG